MINDTAQQVNGLTQAQQSMSAGFSSLNQSWPYQYWYYPYYPVPPRVTGTEVQNLMDVYKKNFGKDWKRIWAQTVRFEVK